MSIQRLQRRKSGIKRPPEGNKFWKTLEKRPMLFPGAINLLLFKNRAINLLLFK